MKYFRQILLIIGLSITIFGCLNQTTPNDKQESRSQFIKEKNLKYNENKGFFEDKFVEHFPSKIDENYISFIAERATDYDVIRFELTERIDSNKIQSIKEKLSKQAIGNYKAQDSSLLVVNKGINKDNYYTWKKGYIETNSVKENINVYPIPNFWNNDFAESSTASNLQEHFTIYVLDSKPGKFIDSKELTDGYGLPQKWKNGFSKGIAVSEYENVIIYWLIIW